MSSYIASVTTNRIRIRHPFLANNTRLAEIRENLGKLPGVKSVTPGASSLLIILKGGTTTGSILKFLEETYPQLLIQPSCAADMRIQRPAVIGKKNWGHSKLLLKALLYSGITCVALGFSGYKQAHAISGIIFAGFAFQHVWERRARL